MSKRIKEGDLVTLYWNDGSTLRGKVISTPQGEGDSWQINDGNAVWLVNVHASHFEAMVRKNENYN